MGLLFLTQCNAVFGADDAEGATLGWYVGNLHEVGGEVYKNEGIVIGGAGGGEYGVGGGNTAVKEAVV